MPRVELTAHHQKTPRDTPQVSAREKRSAERAVCELWTQLPSCNHDGPPHRPGFPRPLDNVLIVVQILPWRISCEWIVHRLGYFRGEFHGEFRANGSSTGSAIFLDHFAGNVLRPARKVASRMSCEWIVHRLGSVRGECSGDFPPVDRSAERPSVSGIPSDELYNYNLNIKIYLIIDLMFVFNE